MNFGWLTDDTSESEFSRVIIHEFGHALGCIHEHQHPNVELKWDVNAVYDYFMGPPNNWKKEVIDSNIFQKYDIASTRATAFDEKSIMLYMFDSNLFTDHRGTPNNVVLSSTDKQFIAKMYPSQLRSSGSWSTTDQRPERMVSTGRSQLQAGYLRPPYTTPPKIAASVSRLTAENFVVNVDAWADTALYSGGATWVEFDDGDNDYQPDTYTVQGQSPVNKSHVTFEHPYEGKPEVIVWLSGLTTSKDRNTRVHAYAENVTSEGFDIFIKTWADSIVFSVTATWIAYPKSKPGSDKRPRRHGELSQLVAGTGREREEGWLQCRLR
ncbi:hypothetical protein PV08_09963 [Exophiala spinifera]|uniref:H-type lectin domain-containing protein n=1 Tax=Exophiala spinifera TaxID=91928 RepID=A0A0D2B253_9EURO|nr:uncharacterized protein PV08_09963 [Exophiala spinifera]KIW12685.1 hypothetical protein PV08_09963 [Exophiala spinifera]